jgi:hypothetical protein
MLGVAALDMGLICFAVERQQMPAVRVKLDGLADRYVLHLVVVIRIYLENSDLEARTANSNVVLHKSLPPWRGTAITLGSGQVKAERLPDAVAFGGTASKWVAAA